MNSRSPTDTQNMSADVQHVLSILKPTLQHFLLILAWFIQWCFETDISELAILQWVENPLKKNYYSNQIPVKNKKNKLIFNVFKKNIK